MELNGMTEDLTDYQASNNNNNLVPNNNSFVVNNNGCSLSDPNIKNSISKKSKIY